MKFSFLTLAGLLIGAHGQYDHNTAHQPQETLTDILTPKNIFFKKGCHNSNDVIVYYGASDEWTELSIQSVENLRKFSHQNTPINTLCSSTQECKDLVFTMRRSLMTQGSDNPQSSCFQDIYYTDTNHDMTLKQLLKAHDTCKQKNPHHYMTYSNYKYNTYKNADGHASHTRDPQAKHDFLRSCNNQ